MEVEVTLYSPRKKRLATYKHIVRPDDILIHKRGVSHVTPHRYMLQSGNEKDCIDVAILAEGYTEKEAIKKVAKLHNLEKNVVYMEYHGGK